MKKNSESALPDDFLIKDTEIKTRLLTELSYAQRDITTLSKDVERAHARISKLRERLRKAEVETSRLEKLLEQCRREISEKMAECKACMVDDINKIKLGTRDKLAIGGTGGIGALLTYVIVKLIQYLTTGAVNFP